MRVKWRLLIIFITGFLAILGGWYFFRHSADHPIHSQLNLQGEEVSLEENLPEVESLKGDLAVDLAKSRDPFLKVVDRSDYRPDESGQHDEISFVETAKNGGTQEITYSDLFQPSPDQQVEHNSIFFDNEAEMALPPLILQGVVSYLNNWKALLMLDSSTYILGLGDQFKDWRVTEISRTAVKLSNHQSQSFVLTLEGMMIDD